MNKYLTKISMNRFEKFMTSVGGSRSFSHPSLASAGETLGTVNKLKSSYGELAHPVIRDSMRKLRGTTPSATGAPFKNTGDTLKHDNIVATIARQKRSFG